MSEGAPTRFEIEIHRLVCPDGQLYDSGAFNLCGQMCPISHIRLAQGYTGQYWRRERGPSLSNQILTGTESDAADIVERYLCEAQSQITSLMARCVCALEAMAGEYEIKSTTVSLTLRLKMTVSAEGVLAIESGALLVSRLDGEGSLLLGWQALRDPESGQLGGGFFDEPVSLAHRSFYAAARQALKPPVAAALNDTLGIWTPELA
jgi:hypothetical protein